MRTIFKLSMVMGMIVMTNLAVAVELLPVLEVAVVDAKKVKVSIMNAKGNTLSILDHKQSVYYQQEIADETFVKSFDFEVLPAGEYVLESRNEYKLDTYRLTISNEGLVVADVETVYYPSVTKRGEMVYVNLFTDDLEPLNIEIYNRNDQLIYQERLTGSENNGQIFDFSKSPAGDYKFLVANHGNVTVKSIKID